MLLSFEGTYIPSSSLKFWHFFFFPFHNHNTTESRSKVGDLLHSFSMFNSQQFAKTVVAKYTFVLDF